MAKFSVEINKADIRAIESRLRQVPKSAANKAIRPALRQASKIVQQEAKRLAPKDSGQTRRAIKVRAARKQKGVIQINVQIGKGDYQGDEYYASFQEFGHRQGHRRLGDKRQWIEGKHFIEQAYQRKEAEAKDVASSIIIYNLEQAINQLGSRD